MASIELQRVASEVNAAASGIQAALDRAERAISYGVAHGLATELNGLAEDEVIASNIDKGRAQDALELSAQLLFFLRGVKSGSNTAIGTAPKSAADLEDLTDKLAI